MDLLKKDRPGRGVVFSPIRSHSAKWSDTGDNSCVGLAHVGRTLFREDQISASSSPNDSPDSTTATYPKALKDEIDSVKVPSHLPANYLADHVDESHLSRPKRRAVRELEPSLPSGFGKLLLCSPCRAVVWSGFDLCWRVLLAGLSLTWFIATYPFRLILWVMLWPFQYTYGVAWRLLLKIWNHPIVKLRVVVPPSSPGVVQRSLHYGDMVARISRLEDEIRALTRAHGGEVAESSGLVSRPSSRTEGEGLAPRSSSMSPVQEANDGVITPPQRRPEQLNKDIRDSIKKIRRAVAPMSPHSPDTSQDSQDTGTPEKFGTPCGQFTPYSVSKKPMESMIKEETSHPTLNTSFGSAFPSEGITTPDDEVLHEWSQSTAQTAEPSIQSQSTAQSNSRDGFATPASAIVTRSMIPRPETAPNPQRGINGAIRSRWRGAMRAVNRWGSSFQAQTPPAALNRSQTAPTSSLMQAQKEMDGNPYTLAL